MWNFGNILVLSPQTNYAAVGQGNLQVAGNAALLTGGQLIEQGALNVSGIGQTNVVAD